MVSMMWTGSEDGRMSPWFLLVALMILLGGVVVVTGLGAVTLSLARSVREFLAAPGYAMRRLLLAGPSPAKEARRLRGRIRGLLPAGRGKDELPEQIRDRVDRLVERVAVLEEKRAALDRYIEVDVYGSDLGLALRKEDKGAVRRLEERRRALGETMGQAVKTLKEIEVKVATVQLCAADGSMDREAQGELEEISRDLDVFIEEAEKLKLLGEGDERETPSA